MRAQDTNTLDLNNLPNDPSRDFFSFFEEGSSSSSSSGGSREKQSKDGKEYECRFCSLKFFKSQALGGHMNRHRQERETESLNKARELVFRNDTFPPPPHHQRPLPFSYHQGDMHIRDLTIPYKPMMSPPRIFSTSALPPPPPPPLGKRYLHQPHSPRWPSSSSHHQQLFAQQWYTSPNLISSGRDSSYTFVGAPVSNGSRISHPLPQPLPPYHKGI